MTDPTPGSTSTPGDESLGYSAALAELEGILRELDGEDIDVDVLGDRVRRASELLRFCRDRIANARFEVEQVVADLVTDTPDDEQPKSGESA